MKRKYLVLWQKKIAQKLNADVEKRMRTAKMMLEFVSDKRSVCRPLDLRR